jgi:glycosyltransferase involved in cell wall biosynthesis
VRPRRTLVVAFVSDAIYPYHRGGKELRYYELARRISELAEVHVYTMKWWTGPRAYKDNAVTFHAISPLIPLYAKHRRSIRQAIIFAVGCLRLLGHRFDVLEADHMPYFQIFVLRFVATLKRKPLVVTWHEVWDRSYWQQYVGGAGALACLVQWLAMRMPDHIFAASTQTAERLREILGSRISITAVPHGIDLEVIRRACPARSTSDLVVVGRLMPHKRVGMLIEAVALLHGDGLPVTCRVIGDGPERNVLYDQARQLGVDGSIEFLHDVHAQDELHGLVKSSKLFVFPSEREGFGLAVLEALACGLPVVTTSSPDNLAQHLVTRSQRGIVCEPSAEAIAEAIRDLLSGHSRVVADRISYEEPWLAECSLQTMVDRVAGVLLA